ncbi:MAG: FAD-binding oxidoreductase [Gemmatimonadota bacterium]
MTQPSLHGAFRTDLPARAAYSEGAGIYRIIPAAVARPTTEEDLVSLVQWARETRTALVPRGAGSSVTGSNVGEGVVVDLTEMSPRVLDIDSANSTVRTGPMLRWGELADAAGRVGLRLPPDPSSGAFATLGGMVSTNASGARTVRFGSVRPWVRGLSLLTVDGDRLDLRRGEPILPGNATVDRFEKTVAPAIRASAAQITSAFPSTRKNSSGYALASWLESGDLIDLLIGSEGTLALITGIEWQLAPVPACHGGLSVALADLSLLHEAVTALLPLQPSALELLDRTFLDLVRSNRGTDAGPPSTEAIILVEFEGQSVDGLRGTVGDAVRRLKNIALDVVTALTPDDEHRIWALRHAASPIIADLPPGQRSLQVIEDACVPVPRMGEYIASVRTIAARLELPIVIFGHAGDGNVHVNVLPHVDQPGWESVVLRLYQEVTARVLELGGTTSGEHGDGRIRSDVLEQSYGSEVMRLFRMVKDAFDPLGILNPGVKIPGTETPASPIERLKTGAGAARIPEPIALALREIERRGDYKRDRLALADQYRESGV